jgi:hypothetical protein
MLEALLRAAAGAVGPRLPAEEQQSCRGMAVTGGAQACAVLVYETYSILPVLTI